MTYKPLTDDLGKELLTSYLAGFPVKTSALQGGGGIDGERSGMWREMARIIHEIRPKFVFVENSPMLTSRGLGTVLGDLAKMGFDAKWGVLGAADIGANHKRDRIWIVGNSNKMRLQRDDWNNKLPIEKKTIQRFSEWWKGNWNNLPKPYYIRSDDGVAARVDRLKAIGNGQVPLCAAAAWRLLNG
jgi:DNA (cytosine-5)-methyltransferase 1